MSNQEKYEVEVFRTSEKTYIFKNINTVNISETHNSLKGQKADIISL